ncbi:anaerobic ribonucleoside-triphosphate reductase [Rhodopseudomonas pseudopalustris]|uniref:Anaerobic ribonucleoside-triphosphate reductase n=1 Tax=Rhodopseudomonas pseudopalustris TaxID=1513892 RepID=A0A1H8UF15_9BRAD|nr:anaerobic ribonucleoside-triphosphate reductase [Rhodopseudomonas pseudopalustris]SEP01696.1 Anaerobic ribonucleoside-triphosphate reductase [Rhodopseudomonas pseudopalustris]
MNAHVTIPANATEAIELTDAERQPCEIWTRVMGYHRPVSSFNRGKIGEFNDRKYFTEARAKLG